MQRELTNRFLFEPFLLHNGLLGYWLVRQAAETGYVHAPHTPANEALCREAVQDMQSRRAGGYFGPDDDGSWYPLPVSLASQINWERAGGEEE